jgi:hypothetical protein
VPNLKDVYVINGCLSEQEGCAVTQAVSRWLPTAAGGFAPGHVEFLVDKVALGQVFSDYFDFLCQLSFHQIVHPHNHPRQVQ